MTSDFFPASHSQVDFDFLVRGQFLRTSLATHMEAFDISTVRSKMISLIHSHTQTHNTHNTHTLYTLSPDFACLLVKLLVLNVHVCVCFAGRGGGDRVCGEVHSTTARGMCDA